MRTTDDLQEPERFQPLGAPVRPQPPAPEPKQVAPGIVRNPDGTMRTNLPLPKLWS